MAVCLCISSVEYSSMHMFFKLHQYFGFSAAVHVVRVINTLKNLELHLVVFGKVVSLILDCTLQTNLKVFDFGMNCFHLIASFMNSSFRVRVHIQLVNENLWQVAWCAGALMLLRRHFLRSCLFCNDRFYFHRVNEKVQIQLWLSKD